MHALTTSKPVVVGLLKNVAIELGQFGIRANCLSPSVVAMPLTMRFLGVDEEGVENLAIPLNFFPFFCGGLNVMPSVTLLATR